MSTANYMCPVNKNLGPIEHGGFGIVVLSRSA